MTRTSHRWQSKPGSFDTLHAQQLFPSGNTYGIPDLRHTPLSRIPAWLVPYRRTMAAAAPLSYRAVVRNPFPRTATLTVRLVAGSGWRGEQRSLTLAARGEGEVELTITPPAGVRCRRRPVALELAGEGHLFGQVAEALVTIGYERF